MSNTELDTSWFNLANYNKLNELNLAGWHYQIGVRLFYQKLVLDEIKKNPILGNIPPFLMDDGHLGCHPFRNPRKPKYQFDSLCVKSATVRDIWLDVISNKKIKDALKCCRRIFTKHECTKDEFDMVQTPLDLILKERETENRYCNYVIIDLGAADEQIIKDFHHWLTEHRKFMGYELIKNITEELLKECIDYRVLQYIDLNLVAQYEGKKITQTRMANLIFSDEYEKDVVARLRKTTKPKAEWLFNELTLEQMYSQLSTTDF